MKRKLTTKMKEALILLSETGNLDRVRLHGPDNTAYWIKNTDVPVNYIDRLPEHWCNLPTIKALVRRGLASSRRYTSVQITEHGKFRAKLLRSDDANA